MIDYHKELKAALSTILPTYYELALTSEIALPCISYMENNNSSVSTGDTLEYSQIEPQVKIWGKGIDTVQQYALQVDNVMRHLGFRRISSAELFGNGSTICKILTYSAYGVENF